MNTFLWDVDDVLFNTDPLRDKLEEIAEERGVDVRTLRTPTVLREIHSADPKFLPGLVYSQGKELIEELKSKGVRCVLASTAQSKGEEEATKEQMDFQRLKIELSGLEECVDGVENVRVSPGPKDEIFAEFAGKDTYFIDNDADHLRSAHLHEIQTIHLYGEVSSQRRSPESVGEVFREATYAAPTYKELIPILEQGGLIEREKEDKDE